MRLRPSCVFWITMVLPWGWMHWYRERSTLVEIRAVLIYSCRYLQKVRARRQAAAELRKRLGR